jgi:predicted esterase
MDHRFIRAFLASLLLPAVIAAAAPAITLTPGATAEFDVELPPSLREIAGGGRVHEVSRAHVAVGVPADFRHGDIRPILIVNATTDVPYRSSRRLAGFYTIPALAAGWIILAADPVENIAQEEDTILLRLALARSALAALEGSWPGVQRWPVAFAGFSGGAKISGWLAAIFALEGQVPLGVFQAGINENTLSSGEKQFRVKTPGFKQLPVFLLSGDDDEIAPPRDHRRIAGELKRAGFAHVRLESFPGPHGVEPRPLKDALEWFRALEAERTDPPHPTAPLARPGFIVPPKSER